MNSIKARLAAFQRSRAGLFVKKVLDDQTPNLAALLAWGTLSAMLPLILGVLSLAGLILRDEQRLDQIYGTLLALVPSGATQPLRDALQSVRQSSAAPAGIVASGSDPMSAAASASSSDSSVAGGTLKRTWVPRSVSTADPSGAISSRSS
jgi:uncharacterized BrkB/YihY/UPF0761 family membrane protein